MSPIGNQVRPKINNALKLGVRFIRDFRSQMIEIRNTAKTITRIIWTSVNVVITSPSRSMAKV